MDMDGDSGDKRLAHKAGEGKDDEGYRRLDNLLGKPQKGRKQKSYPLHGCIAVVADGAFRGKIEEKQ